MTEKIYKVLIVEDEEADKDLLLLLIEDKPELKVIKITNNDAQLEEYLLKFEFDLIFLDIQIQGNSSIETVEKLMHNDLILYDPYIIFTTSLEEHALKAFELGAVDYLLKPFNIARFNRAVDKFLTLTSKKKEQKLNIKKKNKIFSISIDKIQYISSIDKHIVIHTQKKDYEFLMSLKDIEKKLDSKIFIRCHRSNIVSINHIESLNTIFGGAYQIKISDINKKITLPVGRKYLPKIKKDLKF